MTVREAKSKIVASIWQSIAQSGVPVTAIPADQMQTLVGAIADGVLVAVDSLLDEAGLPGQSTALAGAQEEAEEALLWEGRPFLSLATRYQVTTERVRIIRGIIGRDRDDIELIRIQDLDVSQGISERMLGIGDIRIESSDPSIPQVVLYNIKDPQAVHETIRRAMLNARKRFRYSVQEEM
jgi:hypothetical protein